jgi:SH3-like domain-containing protein
MPTSIRDTILEVAARRQGIRYKFGPRAQDGSDGLDCSLYIFLTYRDADVGFPGPVRTAEQIRQVSQSIDRSDLQPGDLLFFEHTYEPDEPPGPDGKIASHVGIALNSAATQMWDCHASNDNTDLPGVGITDINQFYWEPKLFDFRRAPGVVDDGGPGEMPRIPLSDPSAPRFRVTTDGLRLRSDPSTTASVLIPDLGNGSTVTAVDGQTPAANGVTWRHVRTANGTAGWASAEFLEQIGGATPPPPPPPTRYRVTTDVLRLRAQPTLASDTLDRLVQGTVVTEVDSSTVTADEIVWRRVRSEGGTEGWMSSGFLERV